MPPIVAGMAKLMQQLDSLGYQFTTEDLIPGANVILDEAQANCPVDTGFLQASGYIQVESDDVLIGFEAEYASYVEFGTSRMEAQPFLRPALDHADEDALNAITDHIQSHFGSGDFSKGGVQTSGNIGGNLQP
jgi:HK97 gp10 family phage protein